MDNVFIDNMSKGIQINESIKGYKLDYRATPQEKEVEAALPNSTEEESLFLFTEQDW